MSAGNSSLGTIIRRILDGEDWMPRAQWQDPRIEKRTDVKRPFYFIRAYVPVTTHTGIVRKRQVMRLGFCDEVTKREVQERKKEALEGINQGKMIVKSQVPFGDVVEKYLKTAVPKLGAATQNKYRCHIQNHIVPFFGKLRMVDITTEMVDSWLQSKAEPGLNHRGEQRDTIGWWARQDIRNVLTAIFTKAREWKLYDGSSPTEGVGVGRKKLVREKRLLKGPQLVALLAAVDPQVKMMILLAFAAGLRISEVLGLKWKDIDFEAGTVSVTRRWHRGDLDDTKSEESQRTRQLGPLADDLKRFRPLTATAETWMFTDPSGDLYSDQQLLQNRLRPHAKRLGFYWPGFGWHTFRRQNISWKQEAGATPVEAQKQAGHAKFDMTWMYTVTDADREKDQVTKMLARLIEGGSVQ